MPKTRFTADLPPELFAWINEYKDQNKLSRNEALAKAVELLKKKEDAP